MSSAPPRPQDWISDYFSPLVSVLVTSEVEELLTAKNNLTLTELLQPFSKLLTEVTVKDPEGVNASVSHLNVTFQVRKLIGAC